MNKYNLYNELFLKKKKFVLIDKLNFYFRITLNK